MNRCLSLIVALVAAAIALAPNAQARTLDEIYQDMLVQLPQKPCEISVPSTVECGRSLIAKLNLTREAIPILKGMQPAPRRSPAFNAFDAAQYVANGYNDWVSSDCDGIPDQVARITVCDGTLIQAMFGGVANNVGFILQGLPLTPSS